MVDKETGASRGFGFLEFYNNAAADAARRYMLRPDFRIHDREITVTWAEPKKQDPFQEQQQQQWKEHQDPQAAKKTGQMTSPGQRGRNKALIAFRKALCANPDNSPCMGCVMSTSLYSR
eukprot:1158265-Pelagomonas_calceolata.AAC.2